MTPTTTADEQEFVNSGNPETRNQAGHGTPTVIVHSPEGESLVLVAGDNLVPLSHTLSNEIEYAMVTGVRADDMQPGMETPATGHVRRRQFMQSVTIMVAPPTVMVVPPSVFYGVRERNKTRDGLTIDKQLLALPKLYHPVRGHKQDRTRVKKDSIFSGPSPMSREPLRVGINASCTLIDSHSHTAIMVSSSGNGVIQ